MPKANENESGSKAPEQPVVSTGAGEAAKTADPITGDTSMVAAPAPVEQPAPKAEPSGVSERDVALITAAITAQTTAARRAAPPTPGLDKAILPGGLYIDGAGQVVNANGEVVTEGVPTEVKTMARSYRLNRTDIQFEEEE